jgi:hypothetical protein
MNETDWFYYIALAIISFIILYIMYISLHFQNNIIEGLSIGGIGGGGSKKKSKNTDDGSSATKSVDTLYDDNTKLEDILKVEDNKDEYKNMLELLKTNLRLNAVQSLTATANDKNLKPEVKAQSVTIVSSAVKLAIDGLTELEENL